MVVQMRLEGLSGNAGQLAVAIEVFEVAPSLFMVEVRKAVGDTLEYHKFYKNLCAQLKDIIWKSIVDEEDDKAMMVKTVSIGNIF